MRLSSKNRGVRAQRSINTLNGSELCLQYTVVLLHKILELLDLCAEGPSFKSDIHAVKPGRQSSKNHPEDRILTRSGSKKTLIRREINNVTHFLKMNL